MRYNDNGVVKLQTVNPLHQWWLYIDVDGDLDVDCYCILLYCCGCWWWWCCWWWCLHKLSLIALIVSCLDIFSYCIDSIFSDYWRFKFLWRGAIILDLLVINTKFDYSKKKKKIFFFLLELQWISSKIGVSFHLKRFLKMCHFMVKQVRKSSRLNRLMFLSSYRQ